MAAGYGVGASLASMGSQQEKQATDMLAEASRQETERNARNTMAKAQDKASAQQLGGTVGALAGAELGAQAGSIGGPWGALIGGALGAVAAGLFSR